jgi:hypothetical protein
MSDADVLKVLDQMEAWMQRAVELPSPEALTSWTLAFQAVTAAAERGPGWQVIVERAHALGARVEARAAGLATQRDQVRQTLEAMRRGRTALKSYGTLTRKLGSA